MELYKSRSSNYGDSQEKTLNDAGWCHTNVQLVNFSYTWTISSFSMLTEKIESPIFSTGHNGELEWRLIVDPNSNVSRNMSVYLKLVSVATAKVQAKYTFSIINAYSKKINVCPGTVDTFVKDQIRGHPHFLSIDYLSMNSTLLLPNDKLTIFVEINIISDIVNITKGNTRSRIKVPDCQLGDELKGLLGSKELSDIVFIVSGTEVWAHKAILAARSPVFSAMFRQEMEEQLTGRVEVKDIELPVFSAMLHYIYTGKAPNLSQLAEGLLQAAEKYDLRRLKALAEAALCKTFGVENAAKRLMFAHLYKAHRLKSLAIDFINMHTKDVVKTASFKQMMISYPDLVTDVLLGSVTEKKIAYEDKKKGGILELMLLLPGDFLEPKIVLSICWFIRRIC